MKAYYVHDKTAHYEEACSEIVFAETRSQAIYKSDAHQNGVPWTDISATRKKQFDQYSETKIIPDSAYLADGWVYECDICGSFTACIEKDCEIICESCAEELKVTA